MSKSELKATAGNTDFAVAGAVVADLFVIMAAFAALFMALRLLRTRSAGGQRAGFDSISLILILAVLAQIGGVFSLATGHIELSLLLRVIAATLSSTAGLLLWSLTRFVFEGDSDKPRAAKSAKSKELKRLRKDVRNLMRNNSQVSDNKDYVVPSGHNEVLIRAFEIIAQMAQPAAAQSRVVEAPPAASAAVTADIPPAVDLSTPPPAESSSGNGFFEQVLDVAPAAILICNQEGLIELANREASNLLGYPRAELVGLAFEGLLQDEKNPLGAKLREHLRSGGSELVVGESGGLIMQRKDGSLLQVRAGMHRVEDHDGSARVCSLIDLSPVVGERDALRQRNERLEASNSDLEQFAYVASHDLKEPVRKIGAFGDLLRSSAGGKLDEMESNYLNRIVNAAGRMNNMVDDLLNFSRVNTDNEPRGEVDIGSIVDTVLGECEMEIRDKAISIRRGELPVVLAVRSQLFQLVSNLVSNAIKFSADRDAPEITVGMRPGDREGMVCFFVKDNGIGIDPKFHERIFGVFERVITDKPVEGNGIGLAICKKIMDRNHGYIEVLSAPGEGAEFRCHFERV